MKSRSSMVALILFVLVFGVTAQTFFRTDLPEKHVGKGVAPAYSAEEKQLTDEMLDFEKAVGLTQEQKQQLQALDRTYQPQLNEIRRQHPLKKENFETAQKALTAALAPLQAEFKKKQEAVYTPAQKAKIEAYKETVHRALPRGRNPGLISQ